MFDDDDEFERDAGLTPAQRELEGALRGLNPAAPANGGRERLLFKAGVAVGRRSVNRWRIAAAVLVAGNAMWLAATLRPSGGAGRTPSVAQTMPTTAPIREPQQPAVTAAWWPQPAQTSPTATVNSDFLSMRDALLRQGLSALPKTSAGKGQRTRDPLDVAQLLGDAETDAPQPAPAPVRSPWAPLRRLISGEHL